MEQIIDLINEMSPYLLLGFFLAGLMHAFIPGRVYSKYLSASNFRSVLLAALFGIPLPLCSCGVIPTAMSLRREGASKGAATSFLIATPQTGVDSIIATFSLMGLPFAIVRPIAALLTALFGGQMVNLVDGDRGEDLNAKDIEVEDHCGCGCGKGEKPTTFMGKVKLAFRYAFLDMMEDIGKWLVVGLVIAGLITVCLPDSFFEIFKDNSLLSMLLVLCFAVPMYLCATGSIPIAVALMIKGLTPGAGLVLLMAGPACNMASILVINKVMGRRTLITYLASIITGAVGFGLVIDHLLPREWFVSNLVAQEGCCHEEPSLFAWGCTCALLVLLANALWHRYGHGKHEHHHHHHHEEHDHCCCGEHEHEEHEHSCCGGHEHKHDHEEHGHCSCHSEGVHEEHKTTTLVVTGMHCNHCRMNTEKAILSCKGVMAATVDLATGVAAIEGDYDLEEVCKAVESLGFSLSVQN